MFWSNLAEALRVKLDSVQVWQREERGVRTKAGFGCGLAGWWGLHRGVQVLLKHFCSEQQKNSAPARVYCIIEQQRLEKSLRSPGPAPVHSRDGPPSQQCHSGHQLARYRKTPKDGACCT